MLNFKNSLKLKNSSGKSYFIEEQVYSPYDYSHGFVDENGYNIVFNGARHLLKLPAVKNFNLSFNMEYKGGFCDLMNSNWGIIIGYDEKSRFCYILDVKHDYKGKTKICLYSQIDENNKTLIEEKEYDYDQRTKVINNCDIQLIDGFLTFKFNKIEFVSKVESRLGRVGFYRGDAFKEIIISNLSITSSDELKNNEILPQTEFIIPTDNGNCLQYRLFVKIDKVENLYKLSYRFKNDLFDKKRSSIVGDVWAFIFEDLYNAFIRVGNGERLYLFNGNIRFNDDNYDNVPLLEETVATYENLYNVVRNPLEGEFYLDKLPEDFNISFGFEKLLVSGVEYYGGEREFVFSKCGELIESGNLLDKPYDVVVKSPANKRIQKFIQEKCIEKEKALKHLEGNHYFDFGNDIRFNVFPRFEVDDLTEIHIQVDDVFLTNKVSNCEIKDNGNYYEVKVGSLPVGVYHLKVSVLRCGREVGVHNSAFSVLDPSCKLSPQKESGLPNIYVNDGAPANLTSSVQDPWNTKSDSNVNHYHSISHFLPKRAEEVEAWNLIEQYNKKLLVWCTQRAIDRDDYLSGEIEDMQVLKHADYINYGYPGIEESRIYYRYDFFEREVYDGALRTILQNFLNENPSICDKLGYNNVINSFSDEQFKKLLSVCHTEWIDYANKELKKLFDRQWKKIKESNPKAKRQSYGPWNAYQSVLMGAYSSKWFGGNPKIWNELVDGFYQFEDYPFVCGYSTTRGAWALSTIGLLCPEVNVYPEIYNGFKAGCPDGFVSCARPPHGEFNPSPYMQATQISEYVYNSSIYSEGSYRYWENRGFMFFSLFTANPEEKYREFLKTWGVINSNLPKKSLDNIVFVYEPNCDEDRIDLSFDTHAFYNISECNQGYLYKVIRENGLGSGVVTDFNGFLHSEMQNSKAIVLPSLKGVSIEIENAVRKLYGQGVTIIATGNVGNLTDIFGVEEDVKCVNVDAIRYKDEEEQVTLVNAEFTYRSNGSQVLIETSNGHPVLIKQNNAFLFNTSACQVGVDNYRRLPYQSRNNISNLLKTAIANELGNSIESAFRTCDGAGITYFETQNGDRELLIVDYSGLGKDDIEGYEKIVTVYVDEKMNVCDIKDLNLSGEVDLTIFKKEGKIKAFSVKLKSKQSCLLKVL